MDNKVFEHDLDADNHEDYSPRPGLLRVCDLDVSRLSMNSYRSFARSWRRSSSDDSEQTVEEFLQSQNNPLSWIPSNFQKRECSKFVPTEKDGNKCGCGRNRALHPPETLPEPEITDNSDYAQCSTHENSPFPRERWSIQRNTTCQPTDAYGTIEFQGGPHPHKAQFVRLGFDSDPELIMRLFTQIWGIKPPKLVITVHGGMANFNLQPKLARAFRKGLLKAAKTTGAWIITSGINVGVVKHVAHAVSDGGHSRSTRNKVVTIGITPWGLLKKREDLISKNGKEVCVPYHPQAFSPKGRLAVLNDKHSYFLLVDNGTVSRYGADIILRKRLEEYISQQTIEGSSNRKGKGKTIPVVCVVLEGGSCTIKSVLDYVTNIPPVPVVVCDGSGRAADLLSFAHAHSISQDGGKIEEHLKIQLVQLVQNVFAYTEEQAEKVVLELLLCVRKKELITIFRLGDEQDVDHSILTALLKGQRLSAPDQLSLALTWNRPDIARSDIFVLGQEWPPGSLDAIMMEALLHDRVDFVKLLLANGVSMERFLTIQRLEELYNQQQDGPRNTLRYILQDVKPDYKAGRDWISLPLIGLCMRQLMGGTYNSTYSKKEFKIRYDMCKEKLRQSMMRKSNEVKKAWPKSLEYRHLPTWRHLLDLTPTITRRAHKIENQIKNNFENLYNRRHSHVNLRGNGRSRADTSEKEKIDEDNRSDEHDEDPPFFYPFNELLVWAVLTNRQAMARCMWLHGEEALAKALVAMKLYKSLSREAADDYLEQEICSELKKNSEEFRKYSLELLEACYQQDDDLTVQLLTYELTNWGKQTCLTLAVLAHHKEFLAHPACQILLADLWNGGLRIRKYVNWKVLLGLICPVYVLFLDFKTKEELLQQPQTAAEHADQDQDSGINSSDDDSDVRSNIDSSDHGSIDVEHGTANVTDYPQDAARQLNARRDSTTSVKSNASSKNGGIFNFSWFTQKSRESIRRKQRSQTMAGRSISTVSDSHPDKRKSPPGRLGRFLSVSNESRRQTHRPSLLPDFMSNHNHVTAHVGSPAKRFQLQRQISKERRLSGDVVLRTKNEFNRMNTMPDFKNTAPGRYSMRAPAPQDRINALRKETMQDMDMGVKFATASDSRMRRKHEFHGSLPTMNTEPLPLINPRVYRVGSKELGMGKKFYEFYVAPVTTFWSFTMSYAIFLACFTYMTLVATPINPSAPELFVILYIFTLWCDNIRKILMAEPVELVNKVKVFCYRIWNWMSLVSCMFFFVGMALRFSDDPFVRKIGRLIYCINIMYWYLRLLDIFSVNSILGPYITMVGKMVVNMVYICIILTVILAAFGLFRQSVIFPNEEWHWQLVRNIFYKPYFMLYGEVYAPDIDECGDKGEHCEVGAWLTPLFMAIFLLLANILLINLLIAVFNNIFQETNAIAHQLWKFQRYTQVMEYESSPFLPPPFTLLAHVYLLYKYLCKERFSKKKKLNFDYALKLFLKADDVEKIHDFEEEVMDDMMRKKEIDSAYSTQEMIRRIYEHNEMLALRMNELRQEMMMSKSQMSRTETTMMATPTISTCDCLQRQKEQDAKLDMVVRLLNQLLPAAPKVTDTGADVPPASIQPVPTAGTSAVPLYTGSPSPICSTSLANRRHLPPPPLLALGTIDEENRSIVRPPTTTCAGDVSVLPQPTHEPEFGDTVERHKPRIHFNLESADSSDSEFSPFPLAAIRRPKRTVARRVKSLPTASSDLAESISPTSTNDPAFKKADIAKASKVKPDRVTFDGVMDTNAIRAAFRRGEYTSITDSIAVHESSPVDLVAQVTEPVMSPVSRSEPSIKPVAPTDEDQAMARAHPSFLVKHNQMMRELEETGSRIAGCLMEGRTRRESNSMCLARSDDLKDMGLSDPDIRDYLEVLNKDKSSRSSSLDSISSERIEDAEGFHQISECLIDQEEKKKGGSAPQSPPQRHQGFFSGYCADSDSIYSPSGTIVSGTPLTSPAAKASQVFSFDKATLQEFLNQYEEEDERQLLCEEEEEE